MERSIELFRKAIEEAWKMTRQNFELLSNNMNNVNSSIFKILQSPLDEEDKKIITTIEQYIPDNVKDAISVNDWIQQIVQRKMYQLNNEILMTLQSKNWFASTNNTLITEMVRYIVLLEEMLEKEKIISEPVKKQLFDFKLLQKEVEIAQKGVEVTRRKAEKEKYELERSKDILKWKKIHRKLDKINKQKKTLSSNKPKATPKTPHSQR